MLGREKQFASGGYQEEDDKSDAECPNCKVMIPGDQIAAHTIACFRNSTKCKICKEVIQKAKKGDHLKYWRNQEVSDLDLI